VPDETRKSFLLRISPGLWKDLESWAAEDLRSVNGQIEFLLRQAVQKRKHSTPRLSETPQAWPPESVSEKSTNNENEIK
jgi:hypothetical protein